jgi:flagellar motor protein MotB
MAAKPRAVSEEKPRPIIIVKRFKKVTGGHHGGAWKVAYADFVTAMMAFFLVMWLVTAVSKDQRAAIFDYFKNPSMEPGKSVKPAPGQMGPGGASTSPINLHGGLDAPKSSQQKTDRIEAIYKGELTPAEIRDFLRANRVTYVVVGDGERKLGSNDPGAELGFPLELRHGSAVAYRVTS